jgi:hypothetical protein
MNKERRKEIGRALDKLDEARVILETVGDEERDYFDNMPEGIQNSEKGERADEVADGIYDVYNEIETLISNLEEWGE